MGKRYPKEFREDVVRVTRSSDTQFGQLAKDFGVSEASIYKWVLCRRRHNTHYADLVIMPMLEAMPAGGAGLAGWGLA